VVFEPTILVSERPKTHALDRAATGIGIYTTLPDIISPRIEYSPYRKISDNVDVKYILISYLPLNTFALSLPVENHESYVQVSFKVEIAIFVMHRVMKTFGRGG
jgi:hypothetical protein